MLGIKLKDTMLVSFLLLVLIISVDKKHYTIESKDWTKKLTAMSKAPEGKIRGLFVPLHCLTSVATFVSDTKKT